MGQSECGDGDPLRVAGGVACAETWGISRSMLQLRSTGHPFSLSFESRTAYQKVSCSNGHQALWLFLGGAFVFLGGRGRVPRRSVSGRCGIEVFSQSQVTRTESYFVRPVAARLPLVPS